MKAPGILSTIARLFRGRRATVFQQGTGASGVDLADFPQLLDQERVAKFFRECSEIFPGQREICLPSCFADRLMASQPPEKEELRLTKTLRQARLLKISTRALHPANGESCQSALETILFE